MTHLTIPALAKKLSMNSETLRNKLKRHGYLTIDRNNKWELTEKGKEAGGEYYNFYGRKVKFPEDFELTNSVSRIRNVNIRQTNLRFDFFHDVYLRDVELSGLRSLKNNPVHKNLANGTRGLENEEECIYYSALYAGMHYYKLRDSFRFAKNNSDYFENLNNLELFDWGCGQGFGTSVLLEFLETDLNFSGNILIKLNDISKVAIKRGINENIMPAIRNNNVSSNIKISRRVKSINDLVTSDIDTNKRDDFLSYNNVTNNQKFIHIMSNILDVAIIDEIAFAKLFFELLEIDSFKGHHYFFCLSPKNAGAKGSINRFRNLFRKRFSNKFLEIRQTSDPIENVEYYGFLPNKRFSSDKPCTRYEVQFSVIN